MASVADIVEATHDRSLGAVNQALQDMEDANAFLDEEETKEGAGASAMRIRPASEQVFADSRHATQLYRLLVAALRCPLATLGQEPPTAAKVASASRILVAAAALAFHQPQQPAVAEGDVPRAAQLVQERIAAFQVRVFTSLIAAGD